MLSSRFELTAPTQSEGAAGQLVPMPERSAATQDPISPTSGAAISTLESISFGSMSIWMNFFGASPQVLPLPCDSSQLRRAPNHLTASAGLWAGERPAPAAWARVFGREPLGRLIWRKREPVFFPQAGL